MLIVIAIAASNATIATAKLIFFAFFCDDNTLDNKPVIVAISAIANNEMITIWILIFFGFLSNILFSICLSTNIYFIIKFLENN
jgi:hypothetical protein